MTHALDVEVASERQFDAVGGQCDPIFLSGKVIVVSPASSEDQIGWNRHGWEAQFLEREQRLLADFSEAYLPRGTERKELARIR